MKVVEEDLDVRPIRVRKEFNNKHEKVKEEKNVLNDEDIEVLERKKGETPEEKKIRKDLIKRLKKER